MPYSKKEEDFIKYVKSRCKEHGVKCSLRRSKSVIMGKSVRCSGWFDETIPELVVAMNNPDWIGVLAHEYSHLTQYVEQIPLWTEAVESLPILWDWLDGKDHPKIEAHINVARDLELDNEQRAVRIITAFDLNVDINNYIKKANSYVMFYNWVKQTRKWSHPRNSPYNNARLIEAMPAKFNMDYSKIPKRIEKIFREEQI